MELQLNDQKISTQKFNLLSTNFEKWQQKNSVHF